MKQFRKGVSISCEEQNANNMARRTRSLSIEDRTVCSRPVTLVNSVDMT